MRKVTHNPQFFYNPNADSAFWYATLVIEGRWHEAEPFIMREPMHAYRYAKFRMNARWIEAEKYIKLDVGYWHLYQNYFGQIYEK